MMTRLCKLAMTAMIVLAAAVAGAPAQAAEVAMWFVDADRALNVEVQDGGYVVKSERILLTGDMTGDYFYSVELPSGTRFTLPEGWMIDSAPSSAQGIGSAGMLFEDGEKIRFMEGETVLFSSIHGGDIPLAARFAEPVAPAMLMPYIQRHPRNQNVRDGETAVFDVAATGEPPLYYQWQRYGGNGWRNISGAQERTLRIRWAQMADNGTSYRVIVRNHGGAVASAPAHLSVWYSGYDDPWYDDDWWGYGSGCNSGTLASWMLAPLALFGLLLGRRRKIAGRKGKGLK